MNARQLFSKPLNEAGDEPVPTNPPGGPPAGRERAPFPRRPMMRRPGGPGAEDFGEPGEDIQRMLGRGPEGAPRGQFSPKELSQLKDIMILQLAAAMNSQGDKTIGEALMNGQELDPGSLQHILDEARTLKLPESHNALLQKIFTQLKNAPR